MKKTINTTIVILAFSLLAACGGGGSSSGGMDSSFQPSTYNGTYMTGVYSGNITLRVISPTSVAIRITGVSCLQSEFTVEYRTLGNNLSVSSEIPGQPRNVTSNAQSLITTGWPIAGGQGTLFLDPGSNCIPSEGQINVNRA